MARIAVLMLWEAGHVLPTFGMCRELIRCGHQVSYLAIPLLCDLIRSNGFDAVTILAEVFPTANRESAAAVSRSKGNRAKLSLNRAMLVSTVDAELAKLSPDLVLVDFIFNSTFVASLRRSGWPVLVVTTSLPNERSGGLAPLTTGHMPPRSTFDRLAIEYHWMVYFATNWWLSAFTRQLLARERLKLDLPNVVLCPAELDFPRPRASGRHYVGPAIDFERRATDFPWERLDRSKPLIYCSLGTQAHRYGDRLHLAASLVEAVGSNDGEQLVITVDRGTMSCLGTLPENVIAVEQAPQLELLRLAAVAVTHGGLGTIKECIYFGVPMIVCPQGFDQPGNAARVEYHNLGVYWKKRVSAAILRQLLDGVRHSAQIRDSMARMQRVFRSAQTDSPAAGVIEPYLKRPG